MRSIWHQGAFVAVALGLTGLTWVQVSNRMCLKRIGTDSKPFVMTAFRPETEAVLKHASSVLDSCKYRGITYAHTLFGDREVVVFEGGMGPEEAARSARVTLDAFRVERMLFSGVAGAVDSQELSIGDTVAARTWTDQRGSNVLEADQGLLADVTSIHDVQVVEQGATVDHFITDGSSLPSGVAIVDMESHAVATVADAFSVPFLAIRSVSDRVGEPGTMKLEQAAHASARVVTELVESGMTEHL